MKTPHSKKKLEESSSKKKTLPSTPAIPAFTETTEKTEQHSVSEELFQFDEITPVSTDSVPAFFELNPDIQPVKIHTQDFENFDDVFDEVLSDDFNPIFDADLSGDDIVDASPDFFLTGDLETVVRPSPKKITSELFEPEDAGATTRMNVSPAMQQATRFPSQPDESFPQAGQGKIQIQQTESHSSTAKIYTPDVIHKVEKRAEVKERRHVEKSGPMRTTPASSRQSTVSQKEKGFLEPLETSPPLAHEVSKPENFFSVSEVSALTTVPKPSVKKGFRFSAKLELPPIWRRLLAGVIDFALIFELTVLVNWLFGPAQIKPPSGTTLKGFEWLAFAFEFRSRELIFFVVAFAVVYFFYSIILQSIFSKTLGKKWMGIMVVDSKGHKLSPIMAMSRALAFLVFAFAFLSGTLWILVDKYYRGFHDLVTGTMVVRNRY